MAKMVNKPQIKKSAEVLGTFPNDAKPSPRPEDPTRPNSMPLKLSEDGYLRFQINFNELAVELGCQEIDFTFNHEPGIGFLKSLFEDYLGKNATPEELEQYIETSSSLLKNGIRQAITQSLLAFYNEVKDKTINLVEGGNTKSLKMAANKFLKMDRETAINRQGYSDFRGGSNPKLTKGEERQVKQFIFKHHDQRYKEIKEAKKVFITRKRKPDLEGIKNAYPHLFQEIIEKMPNLEKSDANKQTRLTKEQLALEIEQIFGIKLSASKVRDLLSSIRKAK